MQTIEKKLAWQSASVARLFLRGNILEKMGRSLEARNTYVDLLDLDPSHLGALNQLGNLLFAAGQKIEAQRLFSEAVAKFPEDPMSRVNLASVLIPDGNLEQARQHCEHALKIDPNCRQAHAGLLLIFTGMGDLERASWHRRAAFQGRCVIPVTYRGQRPPITVLELISTTRCISRITSFLSDRVFQKYLVVADFYDSSTPCRRINSWSTPSAMLTWPPRRWRARSLCSRIPQLRSLIRQRPCWRLAVATSHGVFPECPGSSLQRPSPCRARCLPHLTPELH